MLPELNGIISPIITPMLGDETISFDELRRQTERMISSGCHAIFCFGTNGEGYALSYEEKKSVLECVIEQANHRVPIYAGTGCITTRETITQCLMAQAVGADVLSIVTPSFAQASQNELYEHYKTVAGNCPSSDRALQHTGANRERTCAGDGISAVADRQHRRREGFFRQL